MARVQVKICGIKTQEALDTAVKGRAGFVGFNFFRPSPRYVKPEVAATLARTVPDYTVHKVAVLVDPTDDELQEIFAHFKPDMLQLHGKETVHRTAELKSRYYSKIIKAFPVEGAKSLDAVLPYAAVADYFMFDGKPPAGSKLPGGNNASFDWSLLQGKRFSRPWFLAGGLNAKNMKEAVSLSGAELVDISSGVEKAPGEKDPALIKALLDANMVG